MDVPTLHLRAGLMELVRAGGGKGLLSPSFRTRYEVDKHQFRGLTAEGGSGSHCSARIYKCQRQLWPDTHNVGARDTSRRNKTLVHIGDGCSSLRSIMSDCVRNKKRVATKILKIMCNYGKPYLKTKEKVWESVMRGGRN